MPVIAGVRLSLVKYARLLDHATHSKISSLTLSARQSFPNLVRCVSAITDQGSRSANGLFLEFDGHGGTRRCFTTKVKKILGERSVPSERSQYKMTQVRNQPAIWMAQ